MTMNDAEEGYHFSVMRRAIDLVDEGGPALPLDALAAEMNMSPAHFQRVFSRWVGVSPKRYQQYLTLGHAKALLSERFTTLETAHSTGLSGSGRLHDLFVRWEAMSPGAILPPKAPPRDSNHLLSHHRGEPAATRDFNDLNAQSI